ncbi:IclR family transcriptional regulator [Salinicola peritrichatus]|uniref:IclR family transcriptional regulator n=1 Tax=Salinicola peritrichatus TaxID=1267424 RepID=UPI000DA21F39|nr:IclR family transcriptional regulator [Salinicola peritrichatus]
MTQDRLFVASLEKAMTVLYTFSSGIQSQSLSEIAIASGLDKSAVQRFTHTLTKLGLLEKHEQTRRYSLGKKTLELSYFYLRADPLIERATPIVLALRQRCNERVNLSLFDDTTILYAIRQPSRHDYPGASLVGRRMPLHCTAGGRAIMAKLDEAHIDDILARSELTPLTPYTLLDPERIRAEVCKTRERGYALAVQESVPGELTLGAAIINAQRQPIAALHIAGSISDWSPADFEDKLAPLLLEAVHILNHNMRL